jgi:hypothetical protein
VTGGAETSVAPARLTRVKPEDDASVRVLVTLSLIAALPACTPTGRAGHTGTPVSRAEPDFPGPDAQSRHRPPEMPAGR